MTGFYGGYLVIALLALVGATFVAVAFTVNRLVRPARPTRQKATSYECGVDPVGEGWAQTQVRYYVFAFLYVLFAVEAVFLFPWAVIFKAAGYGVGALLEMGLFVLILGVGLLYAWRKKVLTWV